MRQTILTVCLLSLLMFTFSVRSDTRANLLPGDPDFEIGMKGWHAHSAGWIIEYLSNQNYENRYLNETTSGIDTKNAFHGSQSVKLQLAPNQRSYLTTTKVIELQKGTYTFSGHAKCNRDTKLTLRLYPANQATRGSFYKALSSIDYTIGNDWQKVSLRLNLSSHQQVIPIIDAKGSIGNCWIDTLSLHDGRSYQEEYIAPKKLIANLSVSSSATTDMPQLFLLDGNDSLAVKFDLAIINNSPEKNLKASISLQQPESEGRETFVVPIDTGKFNTFSHHNFKTLIKKTGIWKATTKIYSDGVIIESASTVFAVIKPHTGQADPFFGTHQKLSKLSRIMGFGAIRDMHLLRWKDLQPKKNILKWPSAKEINEIKTFTLNGGLYLATLVAESPIKNRWNANRWGKSDYGHIPLWAGGTKNTSGGQSEDISRVIKPSAMASYVNAITNKMPFLSLEVMNEPNNHMPPDEYLDVLSIAYKTAKANSPNTTIVGMANSPIWKYLHGGYKSKFFLRPYHWFDRAFELGATDYMDAISIHPYGRTHLNEVPENAYGGDGEARWAQGLADLSASYQNQIPLPIWVSEKGVASPSWRNERYLSNKTSKRVESAITQARWIVRSQIDMKARGIKHYFIFNTPWSTAANHRYFPIEDKVFTFFDSDGLPRPALIAQKVLIETLSFSRHLASGGSPNRIRYEIFGSEESEIIVLWRYGSNEKEELSSGQNTIKPATLLGVHTVKDMYGNTTTYSADKPNLNISPSPSYIIGKAGSSSQWINVLDSALKFED